MRIYLAGRYGRRDELAGIAGQLEAMGHEITSRWLSGEHEAKDESPTPEEAASWAMDDLNDIDASEAFALFTEADPEKQAGRGGRFVELGYALARHGLSAMDRVYLVGPTESNIFTEHIDIDPFPSVEEFMEYMKINADAPRPYGTGVTA